MKLKKWEIALTIALTATIVYGTTLIREQQQLADKLIRLHVVANSDSQEDQALKLDVRDKILEELTYLLDGVTAREDAVNIIEQHLDVLTGAALGEITSQGYDYGVITSIGIENFPTREYDTFSLPAGEYESLRVEIGDGIGQNWWCVVFPPLCASSESDTKTAMAALSDDEISLITEDNAGYTVKFKSLEWLSKLRGWLGI